MRALSQQEELPLLRDHLLRLDPESRHERFNGFSMRASSSATRKVRRRRHVIVAYMENGVVRGAAELHPPEQSEDGLPEIAFSVEECVRRQGVGSMLFRRLISEARGRATKLRVTTGAATTRCGRSPASSARTGIPARRIDRHHRPDAAGRRPNWQADRRAAECRARDDEFQPRLLEDVCE